MESRKKKQPWPTKDAMIQVYEQQLWGTNNTPFYSGEGSHLPEIVTNYIEIIRSFLSAFKTPLIVCDLGCGDFNVGKQLLAYAKQYHAVDIVPALIKHHQKTFEAASLEFHCLDISKDILPEGECALVRQVLQHLSNKEIHRILEKLKNYKYIILTEHLPLGDFTPNKDIISGQGIRLKKQSGVSIKAAPFYFKSHEEKELSTIVLPNSKGIIKTILYTLK